MPTVLDVESSLTDRYQTTVPELVRKTLGLRKRDKIHYLVQPDGTVQLARQEKPGKADKVLDGFLSLLASDIQAHPQKIRSLDANWVQNLKDLTKGAAIDLDKPLPPDGE
jgi:antitoxin PrlF